MIRKVSDCCTSGLAWFKSSYSDGNEGDSCVEVAGAWFKSSYSSGPDGESCLEIATAPATVHVRDSKSLDGPQLAFSPAAWSGFLPYAVEG